MRLREKGDLRRVFGLGGALRYATLYRCLIRSHAE